MNKIEERTVALQESVLELKAEITKEKRPGGFRSVEKERELGELKPNFVVGFYEFKTLSGILTHDSRFNIPNHISNPNVKSICK